MNYKMGFGEFEVRIKEIAKQIKANKKIKDIYGVPRGGLIPAIRLSYMLNIPITCNPKTESTAIIDDLIDTGATKHSFSNFKHFYTLMDKQKEGITEWVDFFWDEK